VKKITIFDALPVIAGLVLTVAVLALIVIVATVGTLTSAQSGMPYEQAVMSVTPPQEAL